MWVWGNAVIDQRRRLPPIGAAGSMAPARPGYRRVQPLSAFHAFQNPRPMYSWRLETATARYKFGPRSDMNLYLKRRNGT